MTLLNESRVNDNKWICAKCGKVIKQFSTPHPTHSGLCPKTRESHAWKHAPEGLPLFGAEEGYQSRAVG